MIKVVTNSMGSGDWIIVLGHSNSIIFSGHQVGVFDLQDILNIVSRDGCELIQVTDNQIETGEY